MRLLIKCKWNDETPRELSFEHYFSDLLDGNGESGITEQALDRADEVARAFGRLMEVLMEKEILKADDLTKIAQDFKHDLQPKFEGEI